MTAKNKDIIIDFQIFLLVFQISQFSQTFQHATGQAGKLTLNNGFLSSGEIKRSKLLTAILNCISSGVNGPVVVVRG